MNRLLRTLLKVLLWIAGIWAVLIIAIELVMSSSFMTKTIDRMATEYVDGEVDFGNISLSMFRRFPNATLTLDDFSLTYPSDRFDALEQTGPQGHLMYKGCGTEADTLASFRKFSVSMNLWALIAGKISITDIRLMHPRIFAHTYADGTRNWNIFKSNETADNDTSSTSLPKIEIGKVRLTDRPLIVYTDSKDTIFAMINVRDLGFDGRLSTGKVSRNRIGLKVDSMFVAGRIAADTIALGLDRLHIHEHHDHMDISAQAKTLIATKSFGRINVPVEMSGTVHFPEDSVFAVGVHGFQADIATVPITAEADLRFHEDRTEIDGQISVTECKVDEMIGRFIRNFLPEAEKIKTDAVINVDASCKGDYIHSTGRLPIFHADLYLPKSKIRHQDIGEDISLALDLSLTNTRKGDINLTVNEAAVSTSGLELDAFGGLFDLLAEDPTLTIDGRISASLDKLMRFVPGSLDIMAKGNLAAEISGKARLSDLSLYTFSRSTLTGGISSENIVFKAPSDSIDIQIGGLKADIGPENMTSRRDSSQSFRMMGITGSIQNADISYKESLAMKGSKIVISAKSSADMTDTTQVGRFGGRISAEELSVTDASGTSISLDETSNGFQMVPKRGNAKVPVLTLTSANKRITLATDVNRAILTDASVRASASLNTIERRQQRKARLDSLQRVYPDIPRDSLMRHAMKNRQAREVPEWLKEEDFKKQDIDIRLDQSLAKYFREWNLRGGINVRTGIVMTPYFPLRNILRGFALSFDNNRISVDSLKVMTGNSNVMAKGELTGLRRALTARNASTAVMNLDLDISTDKMNANEILKAYRIGSNFDAESMRDEMSDASNAEFLQMVVKDTTSDEKQARLLVIPGNINADITLSGKEIKYSDLKVSDLEANMKMKERCVQITNTYAASNIGGVSFEGFYTTRAKQDIRAGFSFNFKDITAEKAINLMPAVDTIMPLLKSFSGNLNCDLAATARLDTNMNILTPSINGVLRISGNDLAITDNDMFTSLAKKLHFNNKKVGTINSMTVEGVIKDNILEVFPFIVKMDRYTLALSGKQNLDLSYRYHASLIKSPMLIKVGVDVYGQDFDNMKFKIGKPKYKNENVPVFTAVIDETRINLTESIRSIFEKGVDAAIRENEKQEAIIGLKEEIGYVNAVDQQLEELSQEEQKQLEESETVSSETNGSSNNTQDE